MAKFSGKIGFAIDDEKRPGVFEPDIVERTYYGDVIRDSRRWNDGESVNDTLTIRNEFSVVSDAFIKENLPAMRYIKYLGTAWQIASFELTPPRIKLSIGGVWNGPTA